MLLIEKTTTLKLNKKTNNQNKWIKENQILKWDIRMRKPAQDKWFKKMDEKWKNTYSYIQLLKNK